MTSEKKINPTLLDYAILGLIQDENLSGYRIRKVFEETALGNYSSSPGSIYPALSRLQKLTLVEKVKEPTSSKSVFKITDRGVDVLKLWFSQTIKSVEVKKGIPELLLRFGFMETLANKEQKIIFLSSFRDLLSAYLIELQDFHINEGQLMPLNGRLAFEHGIDSYKATLKWSKKALFTLKQIQ